MAQKTKQQLKGTLIDGHLVNGNDFGDLVDSLKGMQSPVASPSASGNATAFVDSISQNAEGVITVTKKMVNFDGYQPVAGMSGYQQLDLQQVGNVTAVAGGSMAIEHNMKHYPTVRLIDGDGKEVNGGYTVKHASVNELSLGLDSSMGGSFMYILD